MKQSYLLCILLTLQLLAAGNTRYVMVNGAGLLNGSSWDHAYPGTSLQLAIDLSAPGDEVWVSCGTYFTTNSSNRSLAFHMRNGVAVYGSFQGTETSLAQRIFSCGPCSVLSGEIGSPGFADNSYHVISNTNLDNTAVLDGFVVSEANDDRLPTLNEGLGGGIYNEGMNPGNQCSPVIRNCVVRNNRAVFGAGIFNNGYNGGNASPLISHCIITDNLATDAGGGIDNFGLAGNASPQVINCVVSNNTALTAGGMYCWGGNPGGNANPVLINSVFVNNTATAGNAGGLIADNSNSSGGFNDGNSNPVARNCIFRNNSATGSGPQFAIKGTATFTATYSAIDLTGQTAPHILSGAGTGNLFIDPLITGISDPNGADNCWMTADDGLQLAVNSPAIDAGENSGVPLLDLRFAARVAGGRVDIGAYEHPGLLLPVRFISFNGYVRNSQVLLSWTISQSEEVDHFTIERSKDGLNFQQVALRKKKDGQNGLQSYDYTDTLPAAGYYQYRIKSVQSDGSALQSKQVAVHSRGIDPEFNFQVDRSARTIKIQTDQPVLSLCLIDLSGRVLTTVYQKQLDYDHLRAGVYCLRLQTADKVHSTLLWLE
jgi:hypothetical protein